MHKQPMQIDEAVKELDDLKIFILTRPHQFSTKIGEKLVNAIEVVKDFYENWLTNQEEPRAE